MSSRIVRHLMSSVCYGYEGGGLKIEGSKWDGVIVHLQFSCFLFTTRLGARHKSNDSEARL